MGNENLPVAGKYVTDSLVTLYQSTINQLISDMSRQITVYMEPVASGCPNCTVGFEEESTADVAVSNPFIGSPYNRPFPADSICPVCQGTHQIETVNSQNYSALIQRTPKDLNYQQYGVADDPKNVYRTKTVLVSYEDIKNAKKCLIDGVMCVPIREPVKTGLRDLAYVRAWWKAAKL
jgi:hypothetical protein